MNGLLKMDPRERLTAKEALYHPYFDGLRSEAEEAAATEFKSVQS